MAEIEENLKAFIKEIMEDKDYANGCVEVQPISSGGANYSSALYLASVTAPPRPALPLFAKVGNVGEAMRAATNDMFSQVYETERYFYAEIAVAFERLYNQNGVPEKNRLYIPKYYGFKATQMEETLVLENLAAKGYGNFDRFKTFNWEYASKSVEELAKFHALGLAYREENLDKFNKIGTIMSEELIKQSGMQEMFVAQAVKIGSEMVKEEYRDRMKIFFEKNDMTEQLMKMWTPTPGGLLAHGDYRPSNLMHRRRGGKLEVVPLDYQTYRLGSLASDLIYFIFSGSDAHFRKYYYQPLLDHYYNELTRALKDLRLDVDQLYPRKVFEHDVEDSKILGLFIGLTLMSLLTVEPENAPKIENFENFLLTPNQIALDRLNDIVADFIRWGIV